MDRMMMIHEEYARLKEQRKEALERLSKWICVYDDMILQKKPYLEALYIKCFGALEQACYAAYVQAGALRRKIDLVRAYLNRDAEPDLDEIEDVLRAEFEKYEDELKKMEMERQNALALVSSRTLSDEESKKLKQLYRSLAKKLHPDLNPKQTETVKNQWQRAMDAYRMGDLVKLEILTELVEADRPRAADEAEKPEEDALESLRAQLKKTKEQIASCLAAIERLDAEAPFKFAQVLNDPARITARQRELQEQKAAYDSRIKEHEGVLELLLLEKSKYVH